MQETTVRTKSFRDEDHSYRRVFLRSYPLHWEADDKSDDDISMSANKNDQKKPMKKMILSVFQWGEARVLVLRRFKHKVTVYAVSCIPGG
ncbi:unnamed protein product [Linum tenue]|uniref:Uncharacterized protein n=1 Tax=Linum tenue TaxID=586396 RepID=A0AAV0S277_9ROSI|nr:unnamed protein product [Linum tenue]